MNCSRTHASTLSGSFTSMRFFMTWALAPPCNGPDRAPTPADTAAYMLARVEATTLEVNVEALNP